MELRTHSTVPALVCSCLATWLASAAAGTCQGPVLPGGCPPLPPSLLANEMLPPHSCGLVLPPGEDSEFLERGTHSRLGVPPQRSGVPHSLQAPLDGPDALVVTGALLPSLSLPLTRPPHPTSTPGSRLGPMAALVFTLVSAQRDKCVLSKDGAGCLLSPSQPQGACWAYAMSPHWRSPGHLCCRFHDQSASGLGYWGNRSLP